MKQCDATSGDARCQKELGHKKMHSSTEGALLSMWSSGGQQAPCGNYDEHTGELCVLHPDHEGPHNTRREPYLAVVQTESEEDAV